MEDAVPDVGMQTLLGRHVDAAAEQLLQVHEQCAEIDQTATRFQINQEINVAVRPGISSNRRAEYAHPCCAVTASKIEDALTMSDELREES